MMRLPFYQVGASDAGAHVAQLCGSGDTTVLLENYVKTGQQTLEEAVHYMTVPRNDVSCWPPLPFLAVFLFLRTLECRGSWPRSGASGAAALSKSAR